MIKSLFIEINILAIVVAAVVVLLFILSGAYILFLRKKLLYKDKEIKQYKTHLSEMHDTMDSNKLEYKNTIEKLKGLFDSGDYETIGEELKGISSTIEKMDNRYLLSIISEVNDEALKWLLISKLSTMQKQGINFNLMISKDISYGNLASHQFNQIIENLLDRAIEEAKESNRKHIKAAFLTKNGDTVISVKNTYNKRPVLSKMRSDVNMCTISSIIDKYSGILMDIRITDDYFITDINISDSEK